MTLQDIRDSFIHLRLGFQLLLSPIFLLGLVTAGGRLDQSAVLGFIAFHLFGYAGGTALNSYYDRDVGPIGGLERPPPIPRSLLVFSIIWQLMGWVLALAVSGTLAVIYGIMFIMSLAYSHPATRLKGRPLAALGTVTIGQGILGYLGGWVCGADLFAVVSPTGLLGAAAATLITVGFYPLTGIYQIEEDRQRGDQTPPVWLGPERAFLWALACLALGGLAALALIAVRYRIGEAVGMGLFLGVILYTVWRWSRTFDPRQILKNYRMVMRLYALTSIGFICWIGLHLARIL